MAFFGLRRNNQVSSMDESNHQLNSNLNLFHSHLADLLLPLFPTSPTDAEPLLSLPFLRKILNALLLSLHDFHSLILPLLPAHSPHLSDFSQRLLKSLDILDSASRSLHSLRSSLALALIASSSFPSHPLRSRNSLAKLLPAISPSSSSAGAWSFGRSSRHGEDHADSPRRSLSLQDMTRGLHGGEDSAAYAMSSFVVLVMWCMITAFPSGNKGEETVRMPAVPRHFPWAAAVQRLREECNRKGGAAVMLGELQRMERFGRVMVEEDGAVVSAATEELAEVCREMEEELGPLQKQVREVFHRIARSRVEVMEVLSGSTVSSQ